MADLSSLPIKPDVSVLDLWATPDGAPVAATFSGTNSATDGTRLLDIEVTYTFSDVGVPQAIDAPGRAGRRRQAFGSGAPHRPERPLAGHRSPAGRRAWPPDFLNPGPIPAAVR